MARLGADVGAIPLASRLSRSVDPGLHGVIDEDQRVRVQQHQYRWSAICHLVIWRQNGVQSFGTGWIIGPTAVATAGHNPRKIRSCHP